MSNITKIFIAIFIIVFIVGIVSASARHDEKVGEAVRLYEECVKKEYGMTVQYYHNIEGRYPVCNFNS